MKTSEVWKVTVSAKSWKKGVGEVRGFLSWSYNALQTHGYEPLAYNLNVTTVPKFGRIFCFHKPQYIYCLVHNPGFPYPQVFNDFFVFRGMAENTVKQKMMSHFVNEIHSFWRAKKNKRSFEFQITTLPGTITCTSFTPTKQYTWEEFVKEFPEPSIWSNWRTRK